MRPISPRLVSSAATVTASAGTTYALIQAPIPLKAGPYVEAQLDPALSKAATAKGFDSGLTSYGLLAAGGDSGGTGVLAETLLGGAGALLVLIFVFASFLALLPLLIAGVSILTTFMLVLGLTTLLTKLTVPACGNPSSPSSPMWTGRSLPDPWLGWIFPWLMAVRMRSRVRSSISK